MLDLAHFGLHRKKEYYYSTVLEIGGHSSPKLFYLFAKACKYIMEKREAALDTLQYRDDSVTITQW